MKSKAQASTEFLLFFGIQLLIVTSLATYLLSYKANIEDQTQNDELRDFSFSIQSEFLIAATMNDGFSRNITLPERIGRKLYDIDILSQNLYVTQEDVEIILPIPNITGDITTNSFIISKENGELFIT